jgi:hypothetical protein
MLGWTVQVLQLSRPIGIERVRLEVYFSQNVSGLSLAACTTVLTRRERQGNGFEWCFWAFET